MVDRARTTQNLLSTPSKPLVKHLLAFLKQINVGGVVPETTICKPMTLLRMRENKVNIIKILNSLEVGPEVLVNF